MTRVICGSKFDNCIGINTAYFQSGLTQVLNFATRSMPLWVVYTLKTCRVDWGLRLTDLVPQKWRVRAALSIFSSHSGRIGWRAENRKRQTWQHPFCHIIFWPHLVILIPLLRHFVFKPFLHNTLVSANYIIFAVLHVQILIVSSVIFVLCL